MYNLNATLPHSVHLPEDNITTQPNPFLLNPACLPHHLLQSGIIQNEEEEKAHRTGRAGQPETPHSPTFRNEDFPAATDVIAHDQRIPSFPTPTPTPYIPQ